MCSWLSFPPSHSCASHCTHTACQTNDRDYIIYHTPHSPHTHTTLTTHTHTLSGSIFLVNSALQNVSASSKERPSHTQTNQRSGQENSSTHTFRTTLSGHIFRTSIRSTSKDTLLGQESIRTHFQDKIHTVTKDQ